MKVLQNTETEDTFRRLDLMLFAVPKSTAASAVSIFIVASAFWLNNSDFRLTVVSTVALLLNFIRVAIVMLYWLRRSAQRNRLPPVYLRVLYLSGMAYSLVMAALAMLAFRLGNPLEMAIASAVLAGYVAGLVVRASAAPRLAKPQILLFFVPIAVAALCVPDGVGLAALLFVFCFSCIDLSSSLHTRMKAQLLAEQRLSSKVRTDYLTGLANRVAFDERCSERWQRVSSGERDLTLAMIDLDGFKAVNDTYGHAVGDDVLRQVAERLQRALGRQHLAARLGGDEFAVLFDDDATPDRVRSVSETIVKAIAREYLVDGVSIAISASIGIATLDTADVEFASLLRRADELLYRAKASGRNRVSMEYCRSPSIVPVAHFSREQRTFGPERDKERGSLPHGPA